MFRWLVNLILVPNRTHFLIEHHLCLIVVVLWWLWASVDHLSEVVLEVLSAEVVTALDNRLAVVGCKEVAGGWDWVMVGVSDQALLLWMLDSTLVMHWVVKACFVFQVGVLSLYSLCAKVVRLLYLWDIILTDMQGLLKNLALRVLEWSRWM